MLGIFCFLFRSILYTPKLCGVPCSPTSSCVQPMGGTSRRLKGVGRTRLGYSFIQFSPFTVATGGSIPLLAASHGSYQLVLSLQLPSPGASDPSNSGNCFPLLKAQGPTLSLVVSLNPDHKFIVSLLQSPQIPHSECAIYFLSEP